jgi:prepilin-type N-terminal cleavage/methylation domain-containing protein
MQEQVISQKRFKKRKLGSNGFTLIEILIVVMVLGILAMVIVPQITVSTTDAKESALSTNIVALRNAIELYYHQHNNVYPGYYRSDDSKKIANDSQAATSFVEQLTQYSDINGLVSKVKGNPAGAIYGPYLKSATLPENFFTDTATVLCDVAEDDISVKAQSGTSAWKFYVITGILMANDGGHDTL